MDTETPLALGIVPGPLATRVLLADGPTTWLKARLPHGPRHPRAVTTLAEALALWSGRSCARGMMPCRRIRCRGTGSAISTTCARSCAGRWPDDHPRRRRPHPPPVLRRALADRDHR